MERCRISKYSTIAKLGAYFIFPIGSLFVIFCDLVFVVYFLNGYIMSLLFVLIASFIAYVLILHSVLTSRLENRKFSVSEEGIIFGIKKDKSKFISWDDVPEIAVSVFNASASREIYDVVICVFLTPKPHDFENKMMRYEYALKNIDNFVLIDYSDDALSLIKNASHKEIRDYRRKQIRSSYKRKS